MKIDHETRKKLAELLSYGEEGKKCFIELCTKFLPKETHDAIIQMANGELTESGFLRKINDDALDSYLDNKNEKTLEILKSSEDTRKEFLE